MVDSYFVTPGWDNIKLSEPNPKKLITTFRHTVISPSLELAEQMFLDCPLFLSALPHNEQMQSWSTQHLSLTCLKASAVSFSFSEVLVPDVEEDGCVFLLFRSFKYSYTSMYCSNKQMNWTCHSCSSAGKITGLICREHTCRVKHSQTLTNPLDIQFKVPPDILG